MANQYARKGTPVARQQQLYELYLRRHDRINNWDLVDLGAWSVVGAWLIGKPHDVLYQLAKSSNLWERRTAILATFAFIKRGDLADAFAISELLMSDAEDLIHKASGGMLRAAGDKDLASLTGFLDSHAARMPRVMLRYAIEKLTPDRRRHYLGLAKA